MGIDYDESGQPTGAAGDEGYFAPQGGRSSSFDARLLQEPLSVLTTRAPLIFAGKASASEAMRAMQAEHRGVVLVTEDGSANSRLIGVFTERDVLMRIVDRGRNPATVTLDEIMTPDPECLPSDATIAWVLNKMEVGGFRHVPAVDGRGCPELVIFRARRGAVPRGLLPGRGPEPPARARRRALPHARRGLSLPAFPLPAARAASG